MTARTIGRLGLLMLCLELSTIRADAATVHALAATRVDIFLGGTDSSADESYFSANASSSESLIRDTWLGPAPARAEASASVGNLVNSISLLHMGVGGSVDGGDTTARASAQVHWDDTYLLGANLANDPDIDWITFTFAVDGRFRLSSSIPGSTAHGGIYDSRVGLTLIERTPLGNRLLAQMTSRVSSGVPENPFEIPNGNRIAGDWTGTRFWNAGDGYTSFDGTLDVSIKLTRGVTGDQVLYAGNWNIGLSLGLSGQFGMAEADFNHTLTLTAVTLPDGSKPEDHGFSSSFASGILPTSSVAAVPEPSSVVLLGLGACVTAGVSIRRRLSA